MSIVWQNLVCSVAIVLMVSTIACGSKDPVSLLLDDLKEAAETRDVKGIEKRLSPDFSGNEGINREQALAELRRYFAAYESIRVDVSQVERAKAGDRVTFLISFSGRGNAALNLQNLLPSAAEYSFELKLVPEGDTLKVNRASWVELSTR